MLNLSLFSLDISSSEKALEDSRAFFIYQYSGLFFVIIVIVLIVIGIVAYFIYKNFTKIHAKQKEQDQTNAEQDIRINAEKEKNSRIEAEIEAKKREEERQREEARRNNLLQQMKVHNLYPRLSGNVEGKTINYTITKLETTIGRAAGNDLVLASKTVSSHHAKIVFNGGAFEIFDWGSSHGVKLNGNKIAQSFLKNGDSIELSNVILTIFI